LKTYPKLYGKIISGNVRKEGRCIERGEVFLESNDPWLCMKPNAVSPDNETHEFAAVNLRTGEYCTRWSRDEEFTMLDVVSQPEFKVRK